MQSVLEENHQDKREKKKKHMQEYGKLGLDIVLLGGGSSVNVIRVKAHTHWYAQLFCSAASK